MESTSPSLLTTDNTLERSFFIRMKSTLTKRGVHIKSSGYKVSRAPAGERLLSQVNPRSFASSFPAALGPYNQDMWSHAAHGVLSYLPVSRQGIHYPSLSHFRQSWCTKCLNRVSFLKTRVNNASSASAHARNSLWWRRWARFTSVLKMSLLELLLTYKNSTSPTSLFQSLLSLERKAVHFSNILATKIHTNR